MKAKHIFVLLTITIIHQLHIAAQNPPSGTITTPRGTNLTVYYPPELYDSTDKADISAAFAIEYPLAEEQGDTTATTTYNCHSYAWNMSEGGPVCWIGWVSTAEEDTFWIDYSYTTTSENSASKISYYNDDHSAIQTSTQGVYISKWGPGPLMKHARDYGPEDYEMDYRHYYRLNLDITGSEALLCSGSQRTFTSNSAISGSDYDWIKDNNLSYVDGDTTYYVAEGAGSGDAYIYLQMTTPSGEVATSSHKEFWVGTPLIDDRKVDGNDYYSGYPVCPGDHYLSVVPVGDGAGTATWTIPPGIVYFIGTNTVDFTFPSNKYGLYFLARSANSCGTGSNYSFYISKKTYGCSKSLSITLYPNPASDYVIVSIDDKIEANIDNLDDNLSNSNNYSISIYNNQSHLISTYRRSGKSFEIPIQNLKKGTYIVEVSDGVNSCSKQLIVNKE